MTHATLNILKDKQIAKPVLIKNCLSFKGAGNFMKKGYLKLKTFLTIHAESNVFVYFS